MKISDNLMKHKLLTGLMPVNISAWPGVRACLSIIIQDSVCECVDKTDACEY